MRQTDEQSGWAKRWGRTAAVVALTAAAVVPVTAYAANGFSDVPDSNVFHDDIDWMRDNGVTLGCNPPANDEYCPGETVTREQMAAFMHRLETRGVFLKADGKAVDADKLDGRDGTHYVNPMVMKSGSVPTGSSLAADGEATRVLIEAPARGNIYARHTSAWTDTGTSYQVVAWIERYNPGSVCDSIEDPEVLPGSTGAFSSNGTNLGSVAGAGPDPGVGQGNHEYSFCVRGAVAGGNVDWSVSLEWRAS